MTKPQRRFVDLSIYLENDVLSDPPPLAPKITYQRHADTLPEFMAMIPGTQPEVEEYGKQYGLEVKPSTAAQLAQMLKADADQWRGLIKQTGFTAES